jgi:putative ABC transport system permease protein
MTGARTVRVAFALFAREAVRGLMRNRLRSALSALGIAVGVCAIIAVISIGKASTRIVEEQLQGLGDNLVWVEAGSRNLAGVRMGGHVAVTLTLEDAEAIRREVSSIKSVTPQVDGSVIAVFGHHNWTTKYRGVSQEFLEIRRWPVVDGASFTDEDVKQGASVCLLGQTTKEQLFQSEDPIGETIRIQNQIFKVVGVLGPKGQSANGQDQDDAILLPYTTALRKIRGPGSMWLDDIMCSAAAPGLIDSAAKSVTALLRDRHRIYPGSEDDFNIRHPEDQIKAQIEASQTLENLLLCLAVISLVVGGIGIMNVMLVSVTERTAEIGVRLAVGATEWAIEVQFLGEAVALSMVGGSLGLLVGLVGTWGLADMLHLPRVVPPQALLAAPIFSIAVGLFFGVYPAWRAARLDPIRALRQE